jgi:hypothetical protein
MRNGSILIVEDLLVAAPGKTETRVSRLLVLLAITLSALGGMMVPTFIIPQM